MLVHPCSSCGRPRAVSLFGPQAPCRACGVDAKLSTELESAMAAARTAVMNLPLRHRQLWASEQLVLGVHARGHALRWTWAGLAFPLIIAMFVGLIATTASWSDPEQRPTVILGALVAPLLVHLACGWVLRRKIMREARQLREELHLRPSHDGSYRCRVCGAPIATSDLDAPIIACAHCQAHNLLDRGAILEAATEEIVTFESFRDVAVARANRTKPSARAITALIAAGTVALVVVIAGCYAIDRYLTKTFHPDATVTWAAYREGARHCFSFRRETDSDTEPMPLQPLVGTTLYFGDQPYVVARVGKDGWGRIWMQSDDGRWSRPIMLCWPKLEP